MSKLQKKIIFLVFASIVILLLALWVLFPILFVGKVKSESELYGIYIADYEYAKETLTLHEDGSFTQQVTLKDTSEIFTAKGEWEFDFYTYGNLISFDDNMMSVVDGHGKYKPDFAKSESGGQRGSVTKRLGRVVFGSDELVLYKKQ